MENQNEFFGLPLPERLMQTQQLKGSAAFYELYKSSIKTAQDVFKENGAYIEELKAKYDALPAGENMTDAEMERNDMINRGVSDITNSNRVVMSALGAYGDAAGMIEVLEKGGFVENYIMGRKHELIKENNEFNLLLTTLSHYMQVIINTLAEEVKRGQASENGAGVSGHEAEEAPQDASTQRLEEQASYGEQLAIYQSWLQRTFEINSALEKRLIFIEGLLRVLKKDLTNLQVHQMEQQAADRRRAIAEQRYKKTLEDVKDYDDLEGQYRHHYDEEGNLVETVEGGEGGNKRGIMVSVILLGIVLIGIIIYIMLKK